MDKQTAIINHRHMWGWLSENPEKDKNDYFRSFPQPNHIQARCFLCQYGIERGTEFDFCDLGKKCLLKWTTKHCMSDGSLYENWSRETNPTRRAELARQIRDLPEREEKKMVGTAGSTFQHDYEKWRSDLALPQLHKPSSTTPPPPKLTRSEAIAKTRKQWRWYARNPDESKRGYFTEHGLERPSEDCYLCEYTRGKCLDTPGIDTCGWKCPLKWPGGACILNNRIGLYNMWHDTDDDSLRISIAWLISRLPEKKE